MMEDLNLSKASMG